MVYDDEVVAAKANDLDTGVESFETSEAKEIVHQALGILTEDQQEVSRASSLSGFVYEKR